MEELASNKNSDVAVDRQKEKKQAGQKAEKSAQTFEFAEVIKASKKYFKGDELAATVWANKYALKDSTGKIYERTPDDMHRRISREIARIEKRYPNPLSEEEVFELIRDFKYIVPQGSPMTGIGNNFQIASLSNCFVIGVISTSPSPPPPSPSSSPEPPPRHPAENTDAITTNITNRFNFLFSCIFSTHVPNRYCYLKDLW